MTETTSQVTTLSPREWPDGLETAGRPLPFMHVEVRGSSGRPAGPGEEGEIFVRGPTVAEAYFEEARLNETTFDRRWFRTGDFGAWDQMGRLRLLDRRVDRIVVSGENVSPAEVERVLLLHPAVADACVVAAGAGARGQEVAAALVLRPGAKVSLEELRLFAGRSLAPFKLPRRIHITDALPRNDAGKFLRGEVRSRFAEEMAEKDRA
jgi:acyl-CoA synthetase (AMP-forming)/AMP-acid ligase II